MKKVSLMVAGVGAGLLFSGCSSHYTDPEITHKAPSYVEQIPSKDQDPTVSKPGSLFGQGESPLFSDRKAMRVNDIVRVMISESTVASSSGKKKLAESTADALGGGLFTSTGNNPAVNAAVGKLNGLTNLGMTTTSESSYQGTGTNDRTEKFTTTISARVIKVMENGTYFIAGSREIMLDGEKQYIAISGVIRGDDIDQTNKIDSAYISDAKISYKTQGDINRATNRGWFGKTVDSVWPF